MSDDVLDDDNPSDLVKKLRAQIDEANRKAREAETRAHKAEATALFAEAGLPLGPTARRWQRGFLAEVEAGERELTVEQIRQAAVEDGLLHDDNEEEQVEQAAHERIADASRGAGEPTPPPDLAQQFEQAETPEQVLAAARAAGIPVDVE